MGVASSARSSAAPRTKDARTPSDGKASPCFVGAPALMMSSSTPERSCVVTRPVAVVVRLASPLDESGGVLLPRGTQVHLVEARSIHGSISWLGHKPEL